MAYGQKTNLSMQQLKTDFDESIGKINIIPQDIGRVILESDQQCILCSELKKRKLQADNGYEPTVSVSYKKS